MDEKQAILRKHSASCRLTIKDGARIVVTKFHFITVHCGSISHNFLQIKFVFDEATVQIEEVLFPVQLQLILAFELVH